MNEILWSQNDDFCFRKITWRKEDKSLFLPQECTAIQDLMLTTRGKYKDFEEIRENWANYENLVHSGNINYIFSEKFPNNGLGFEIIGYVEKILKDDIKKHFS